MKLFVCFISLILFFCFYAEANFLLGEQLMKKSDCLVCHSKENKLVGPSFLEIAKKYAQTKDNQTINVLIQSVKNGTSGKWGPVPMSAHPTLSDETIRTMVEGILSLQSSKSKEERSAPTSKMDLLFVPDEAYGSLLFQGQRRFKNGGASCLSCHHVMHDTVASGGVLARDLTSVFSRMGASGVQAILNTSPFPVMNEAYKKHNLTPEEIQSLVVFLKFVDENRFYQLSKAYGVRFFLSGLSVSTLFFTFFFIFGIRRKKSSVNQAMYDRQM